jgi:hypothetical protein
VSVVHHVCSCTASLRVITAQSCEFLHIAGARDIVHCVSYILPAEETLILCYRPDWRTCCAVVDEN